VARFLFATMPVPGHVAPIAPIVRRLVSRQHEVVWYTSEFFRRPVEATGASFRPIVSTLDFGDGDYDAHFPRRAGLRGLRQIVFDFEHAFVGSVEGYVHDLRTIADELAPDVLVTDPAVGAGWILETVDGLPTATVNVTVLGLQSRDTAPFGLGLRPASGPVGAVRNRVLYWLVDHVIFRRVNRAYRSLAHRHGWPIVPFRPRAGRFLYLQPSIPALEYPTSDLPPQVHFVGPLLPDPPADFDPPAWWADVDAARAAGRPVVLVTQGTVATDPAQLLGPTVEGLGGEDVLVVVAGADPAALGTVPANTRVAPFVPFGLLMPSVDVYVTNGGFGGVMIALAQGVPVVVAGTSEDKSEVAARVAYAGVGLNLRTERPAPAQVAGAVRRLIDQPAFVERARQVAAELARYDAPDLAVGLLERLAETGRPVLRDLPGLDQR
jgi:UDP:flavonoid glycosyltransferase YjiC (YdhE family)